MAPALQAQFFIMGYGDVGISSVSEGLYEKIAFIPTYQKDKNKLQGGFSWTFSNPSEIVFSGWFIDFSREFSIKEFPVEIKGFYCHTPFSNELRESNVGIIFTHTGKHAALSLGNNSRIFRYRKKALASVGLGNSDDTDIREIWNLMYSFTYFVRPTDNFWNLSASIGNYDYFITEQETNPVVNLKYYYQSGSKMTYFVECWYKSAGLFNMYVNYFGFFIRTGLIWKLR